MSLSIFDPIERQIEPHIRAITGERLEYAILAEATIEIVVFPSVGHRRDAPSQMIDARLKAAVMRQVWKIVPEMPFSEERRFVSRGGEGISDRRKHRTHEGAARTDTGRAVATRIDSGQQLPARGSAHRRHVEVGQPNTLLGERVQIGRLEYRVLVSRKISIALIVAEYNDHVWANWLRGGRRCGNPGSEDEAPQENWRIMKPLEHEDQILQLAQVNKFDAFRATVDRGHPSGSIVVFDDGKSERQPDRKSSGSDRCRRRRDWARIGGPVFRPEAFQRAPNPFGMDCRELTKASK